MTDATRIDPSPAPPSPAGPADLADPDLAELGGWGPSTRARRAEALAQRVLSDAALAAPLRALVRRAADVAGAETAQISIISTRQIAAVVERGTRQRPGSAAASPGSTASFEDTICAVSVRADAPVVIPDTRRDSRVASVPAVRAGVVASYLGVPVRTADGLLVAVLCSYDAAPRAWTPAQQRGLQAVAGEVARALDDLLPPDAPPAPPVDGWSS